MRVIASAKICAIESCTNFGCDVPLLERDRVGEQHLLDLGLLEYVDRFAGENSVRRDGEDAGRAARFDRFGRLGERAAGRNHVVDDDRDLPGYVADDVGDFRDVGLRAALKDDGERAVQPLGEDAPRDARRRHRERR